MMWEERVTEQSLTSAPVVPCSCAEGWKPEGWAYCADCYEGQIDRLHVHEAMSKYWRGQYDLLHAHIEKIRAAVLALPSEQLGCEK